MILPGFPRGQAVFFVISGFLITHQIVSQPLLGEGFLCAPHFANFTTFAARYSCRGLRRESLHIRPATAAMVSNYYFTVGSEYFSPRSEILLLLHTWSLGVVAQL